MRTLILLMLLSVTPGLALAAGDVADQAAATTARVAGGQIVNKAQSAKTAAQWAQLRPDYRALRPGLTR